MDNKFEITDRLIENVAWTIYNFYPSSGVCEPDEKMRDCASAMLIMTKYGYGDCMSAYDFMEYRYKGEITKYDGSGYFCDRFGNKICDVWSTPLPPEGAEFVMWFNK